MAECDSDLEDFLKCSICKDTLKEPKVLQCGHTFCLPCLKVLSRQGNNLCPVCRKALFRSDHSSADDLTTNFGLKAIIESRRMKQENVSSKSHKYNGKKPRACAKHVKEPCKFWCSSCSDQVCSECLLGEHKLPVHVIRPLEDEKLNRKKVLENAERELHSLKDCHLQKVSDSYTEAQTTYTLAKEALENEVRDAMNNAKKNIDEQGASLLKVIDETAKQDSAATSVLSHEYRELDGLHFETVSSLKKMLSDLEAWDIPSADTMGNFNSLLKKCNTKIPDIKPINSRKYPNLQFIKDTVHPMRLGHLVSKNSECVGVMWVTREKYVLVWDERHLNLNVRLECFQQEGKLKLWEYTLIVTPSIASSSVIVSSNFKESIVLACNNCVYFLANDDKGGKPSSFQRRIVGNSETCISHIAILTSDIILYRCNKTGAFFRASGNKEEKFNSGMNCFTAFSYFENGSTSGLILWKSRERELFFFEGKSLRFLNRSKSKNIPVLVTGTTFGAWVLTSGEIGWSLSFWGWTSPEKKGMTKDLGEVPVGMSSWTNKAVVCFRDGRVRMFNAS